MSNFTLNFEYPWLLLLLIPGLFLSLFPYFRLSKKYRRNRNRIISLVLHTSIVVIAALVLSGFTMQYDVPNPNNEVLLVVDTSYSSTTEAAERDAFVHDIISESGSRFKVGVVTFGYDQVYAAELGNDTEAVYSAYVDSLKNRPVDDSASDIGAAVNYAKTLLQNPQTAKIIVISDGIETDGDAVTAVKQAAADGIKISSVSSMGAWGDDVQLLDIALPDRLVKLDEKFDITLTVKSSYEGPAVVTLFDDDVKAGDMEVTLRTGEQDIVYTHSFSTADMHELRFEITSEGDTLAKNNRFVSYMFVYEFKDVLVLENFEGDGRCVTDILNENNYSVQLVNINTDPGKVPSSLFQLRNSYQQVILANVSNADLLKEGMPAGFPEVLNAFVQEAGGGVFTIGGCEPGTEGSDPVAHAFNQDDMSGRAARALREILPVEVIPYHPPMGVVFLIDRSDSMRLPTDLISFAKESAIASLDALQNKDYVGVVSLAEECSVDLDMTPVIQRSRITEAIEAVHPFGESKKTFFRPGLVEAYRILNAISDRVVKKHIVFLTDGQPKDDTVNTVEGNPPFGDLIAQNYEDYGITLSIIATDTGSLDKGKINEIVTLGHGREYYTDKSNPGAVVGLLKEELSSDVLSEVQYKEYTPKISEHTQITADIDEKFLPTLGGFFGVRAKSAATTVLEADYAPLYCQWEIGKGKVGAFMCTLSGGPWSSDFVSSTTGKQIISNIVKGLMPVSDISASDISVDLIDDNYSTRVSIMTDLEEGETLEVEISSPAEDEFSDDIVRTEEPKVAASRTTVTFTITDPGIQRWGLHKITVRKKGADGVEKSRYETYKAFSYSREYDGTFDPDDAAALMREIASSGRGDYIEFGDVASVYKDFVITEHKVIDPRVPLMIIAIIFFLLDIAVRKFKFKWIHEIIRDRRERASLLQNKK